MDIKDLPKVSALIDERRSIICIIKQLSDLNNDKCNENHLLSYDHSVKVVVGSEHSDGGIRSYHLPIATLEKALSKWMSDLEFELSMLGVFTREEKTPFPFSAKSNAEPEAGDCAAPLVPKIDAFEMP